MKSIFFATVILTVITGGAIAQSLKMVSSLQQFEADWLKAILNQDVNWLDKLKEGNFAVRPGDKGALDERQKLVADLTQGLWPTQSKVRITGTIRVLSNEPGRSRSFDFLDTFNKKNGKWEVIATNLSEGSSVPDSIRSKPAEAELADLESAWAQVDVTNDRSIFDRIIAPEFVSTSISGQVRNRAEWMAAWQYENVKSAVNNDVHVNVISDSLAIVTGIDVTTKLDDAGRQIVHQDRFTDTWIKRPQGWQVVAAQVTRLK